MGLGFRVWGLGFLALGSGFPFNAAIRCRPSSTEQCILHSSTDVALGSHQESDRSTLRRWHFDCHWGAVLTSITRGRRPPRKRKERTPLRGGGSQAAPHRILGLAQKQMCKTDKHPPRPACTARHEPVTQDPRLSRNCSNTPIAASKATRLSVHSLSRSFTRSLTHDFAHCSLTSL